ncbi:PHB depolymerase family esterase [Methylibium sp.]|uniref:extracellular catalytic domain type 1 short-chain-length polyhydroxyalkanoate depolymerase n=1 Tax=Methylibium sp. TaxID=2067992 RepID=UPI001840F6F6|nr:PHB depolymerase family esterase [Methylibium sp.]MBA3589924.1 PHB depolymerase family esterase [Methylibium sp.]
MNHRFAPRAPAFNSTNITETIERALASAGLQTKSGPMLDVTETIRRALASAGMESAPAPQGVDSSVIDVVARVVSTTPDEGTATRRAPVTNEPPAPGQFVTREFSNRAGKRAYKLYVPTRIPETPVPMIVMLHGCTQSPDDFAAGTQMNRLAEEHGFLVVYPEQAANANASKCWNWFNAQDQMRDSGEPSLIAGITREVALHHLVDPRRIFVAGLSAGAAMAVVMGETYPDLYAAIGAHSGLPYRAAHDIPSALAAMKASRRSMGGPANLPGTASAPHTKVLHAVPIIVFHGDRDHTVRQANGAEIIQQACSAHAATLGESALRVSIHESKTPRGRAFSRTVHADAAGHPRIESWVLHGAGHAWSGGHASGSYTDGAGPDASAEMVRFFLGQPRAGSA